MELMVDIETLGCIPGSVILSIGAVKFEVDDEGTSWSPVPDGTFHRHITISSCLKAGLTVDQSTILFWLDQSKAVQEDMVKGLRTDSSSLIIVLNDFFNWIPPSKEYSSVWSHSSFDMSMLDVAFSKVGLCSPWNRKRTLDLRTIEAEAVRLGIEPFKYSSLERLHNALKDCFTQIQILLYYRRKIKELMA